MANRFPTHLDARKYDERKIQQRIQVRPFLLTLVITLTMFARSGALIKFPPPTKVVLTNAAHIPDYWIVYEVEMYFGYCPEQDRVPYGGAASVFDSGNRREFPDAIGFAAFDRSFATNWTSDCMPGALGGGCKLYEAYIGLSLRDSKYFAAASNPNSTGDERDKLEVRCIRVFQSADSQTKSDSIAVQMVYVDADEDSGFRFETLVTYDDISGGTWALRPAPVNSLWRVTNMAPTPGRWAISELKFYSDYFCSFEVRGAMMSSGTFRKGQNAESYARDGNLSTKWVAGCSTWMTNSHRGCAIGEAWIGMDFGDHTPVRCLMMSQSQYNPLALMAEAPSFTTSFALEKWDGNKWTIMDKFVAAGANKTETGSASTPSPFFGKPAKVFEVQTPPPIVGIWEDTRPPDNSAWRLGNDDWTKDTWKVYEAEFYDTVDCKGAKLDVNLEGEDAPPLNGQGDPVTVQGPNYRDIALNIFDGDVGQNSGWETDCRGHAASTSPSACNPMEGWFGLFFRNKYPTIKCFKIFQSRTQLHTASGVELSRWTNGTWKPYTSHRDLGGGGWNRRPSAPFSMWRVFNAEPVLKQWKMYEIRAYNDPMCIRELYHGQNDALLGGDTWEPLSSGYLAWPEDTFANAFDGHSGTNWGADCTNCSRVYGYWVGAQLPNNTKESKDQWDLIRCVKAWQSKNYDEQASRLRVDIWDGNDWVLSPLAPGGEIGGYGGGYWVRSPAAFASKWRLISTEDREMRWRFEELELYSDTRCENKIRKVYTNLTERDWRYGGAAFHMSGYVSQFQGFDIYAVIGDKLEFSEGAYGMDGIGSTAVLLNHTPHSNYPAWFAIDLLSEVSWVRCVRFKQGAMVFEQTRSARLQWWDGRDWTNYDAEISYNEFNFEGLAGGGWNRRPATAGTMWRLENMDDVPEGWAVYEIEFHEDALCSSSEEDEWRDFPNASKHGLEGDAISSGYVPDEEENGPHLAFDGVFDSAWISQCSKIPNRKIEDYFKYMEMPPVGCKPREAWIGLDFGNDVRDVLCVRIRQTGYASMGSENVAISKWNGERWEYVRELRGLGGSTWDQRPAAPNTMWRAVYKANMERKCRGELKRPYARTWGINEIEFYSDDDCTEEVPRGRPIVSGSLEAFRRTTADPDNYNISNAFDGDIETAWGANCRLGWRDYDRERVDCLGAFFGFDFGNVAVEVRCMRLMQARFASSTCCDTAQEIALERWNGTLWVEATWRHEPPEGYHDIEPTRQLGAHFMKMGKCLPESSEEKPWNAKIWEQRFRRQSDNCVVPLSGATVLLGDSPCVEHTRCAEAFGAGGQCCPMGSTKADSSENRCCCSFLTTEPIYVDEIVVKDLRKGFQIEYATIVLATILPFAGLAVFFWLFILAMLLPINAQATVMEWAYDEDADYTSVFRRFIFFILWPHLEWRSYLASRSTLISRLCCHLLYPKGLKWRICGALAWHVLGLFVGGVGPWVGLGAMFGQVLLWMLFRIALPIRWSVSPFDPDDERDMELREVITDIPLKEEEDTATAMDVSRDLVGGMVTTVVYFLKFIFDMLITRGQLISYGAIPPIDANRVVDIFPGLISLLREPADLMYTAMILSGELIGYVLTNTIGIPQCRGTCTLYASCALIMVLFTICKWQNYDFFGLFAAARQTVKYTRPECQRAFGIGGVLSALSLTFGGIQCAMVLFARALTMANPFRESVWMCDYDDSNALYLGVTLMTGSSIVGCVVFFLSVNGHFMGQDYIMEPLGKYLHLDFRELDPDGGDATFRMNVFMAMIPTVTGTWWDPWNVHAYMIKERAKVFSEQLRDPQKCTLCGKIHTKYQLLFVASGRQVSLACQILPYGVLVGKFCEYINDPPLLYWGKLLPCATLMSGPTEPRPTIHRSRPITKILFLLADALRIEIDYGLPATRRLINLLLYFVILEGTFGLTEDNLVEVGRSIINKGFILAFLKGMSENFAESLCSFGIGAIFKFVTAVEGTMSRTRSMDLKRTALGQIIVGGVIATQVGLHFPFSGWTSSSLALLLALIAGYAVSLLYLLVSFLLEEELVEEVRAPRGPVPTAAKIALAVATGGLFALAAHKPLGFQGTFACSLNVVGYLIFVQKLVFVEKLVKPEGETGIITLEMKRKASPTFRHFFSQRLWSAVVSTFVAGLVGVLIGNAFEGGVNTSENGRAVASLLALNVGLPISIITGLTIDRMLENGKYGQLSALALFWTVCYFIGLWNLLLGVMIGAFAGAAAGSLYEQYWTRQLWKAELEEREREERELREREEKALAKGVSLDRYFEEDEAPPPQNRAENLLLALENMEERKEEEKYREEDMIALMTERLTNEYSDPDDAFSAINISKSGAISRAEFVCAFAKWDFARRDCIKAFNVLDAERNDGKIDRDTFDTIWEDRLVDKLDEDQSATVSATVSGTADGQAVDDAALLLQALEDRKPSKRKTTLGGSQQLAVIEDASLQERKSSKRKTTLGGSQQLALVGEANTELALIDNCNFDRDDLTMTLKSKAPPKNPEQAFAADIPNEELFGRWDKGQPGSPTMPKGHSETRNRYRPKAKPSLLKHRDLPPPPKASLSQLHKASTQAEKAVRENSSRASGSPQASALQSARSRRSSKGFRARIDD